MVILVLIGLLLVGCNVPKEQLSSEFQRNDQSVHQCLEHRGIPSWDIVEDKLVCSKWR